MTFSKITCLIFVLSLSLSFSKSIEKPKPPPIPESGSVGFRFSDEYFTAEATENQEKPDGCIKMIKNSMICMICKDPETNAKYEQCAYASHPNEKAYLFSKKKSIPEKKESLKAKPRLARDQSDEEESDENSSQYSSNYYDNSNNDDVDESESSSNDDGYLSHYDEPSSSNYESFSPGSSEYTSESEKITKKANKDKCEEVQKDDMICLICQNSDDGGNYEKCSYAYKPNDKTYTYSKSNSFGYPDDKKIEKRKTKKTPQIIKKRSDNDEEVKPEESKIIEDEKNGCHKIQKDSMICTICKDPKTNGNSENCYYSYKPDDKLFAYTASKSFGTPKKTVKKLE